MSYYGGTVTVAGRNLITSLMAGDTLEFTRVVVGSGSIPEGVEPIDMTALVAPVANGVSTVPVIKNGVVSMTVEYRNDLNGGLENGFWLREFGVFAKTEKTEEILLYYATLGDSPQPVNAYKDNRIDIRRYPISIALEIAAELQVTYNPGAFITAGEAQEIINAAVRDAINAADTVIIRQIEIPTTGWEDLGVETDYRYRIDIPVEGVLEEQYPDVALHMTSHEVAQKADLCRTVQTLNGVLRFFAKRVPASKMAATAAFISPRFSKTEEGVISWPTEP